MILPGGLALRVRRMTWEAEGVVSLDLARDGGGELPPFGCGAHIDLVLTPDLIRQYSLCSDPCVRHEWTIAVLNEPNSRGGSRYVHEVLRPGMKVEVGPPRNTFPLVDAPAYQLIAGGIGITPFLSMVRRLAASRREWRLLYGGRRRASMAFTAELAALGSRVTIAPQDEDGLLDLETTIAPLSDDTAVYCCGPEPLIAAVEATCSALDRPPPHVERFTARKANGAGDGDGQRTETEFDVVLSGSGRRFTVPPNRTIIEVLGEAGVFVPTSCTQGYCGVCQTKVVSGTPDHRDDYLAPDARARNDCMMVCVGRSRTAELVLDL